ncbi:MAG: nicotinate (nicotinamide) nucleotide adenylyltransferase, partial [Emcibacteraceae bacterium]|nr:nicotinate (nicotinamide) nucleotide adenylyltransferase [Emcibacteraceae bacterium]
MNIGLYFGSFNPIHVGHLIIAQYMIQRDDIDAVWFVVSPQNPFKNKTTLLQDYHRLALVRIATEDEPKFKAEDIEFGLPQPSYTIDTLTYLKEKHPDKNFSLLMGEDNLRGFNKWKNYEQILANHHLFVYPRI